MEIPVQQFPVLTAGQMSPYHQALQTGLDDYMKTTKAIYAPAQTMADINSKNAYANNISRQIAATVLSNPLAIASMSNDQRNSLLSSLTAPRGNMGSGMGGSMGVPGTNSSTHALGSLWDWGKGLLTGDQNSNPAASNANSGMSYDQNGNNIRASDSEINQAANGGSPQPAQPAQPQMPAQSAASGGGSPSAYDPSTSGLDLSDPRMNVYGRDFGSPQLNSAMAKQYPSPFQTLELKKRESSIAAGAHAQGVAMQKLNDEATASTGTAYQLEKDLDTFHSLYKQSNLVGPSLGWAARFGTTAGQLPGISTSMQTGVASQLFGNKITNYKEQLAKDLKLNPSMSEEAETGAYERLKAGAQRVQEFDNFVATAQDKGITDPNKIKRLWNHYNIDMPIFDGKTRKVIPSNLGQSGAYIDSSLSGSPMQNKTFQAPSGNSGAPAAPSAGGQPANTRPAWPSSKSPTNGNDPAIQGQVPPPGTIWMVTPKGKQVPVATQNEAYAKAKYNYRGIND